MSNIAIAPAHRVTGSISGFGKKLVGTYVFIKNTNFSTSTVGSWVLVYSFTYTNGAGATIELENNLSMWLGTASNQAAQRRCRIYSSYAPTQYFYSGAQYTQWSSNIDYRWHFNSRGMWENVPAGTYTYYLHVLATIRNSMQINSSSIPSYEPCNFILKEFR